ncbi:MAG: hypothetical protein HFE47_06040 [Clostridia bacterium]|nr:hypothetical protein [Clostridia bacterium]
MITIIGLGTGKDDLTRKAAKKIAAAKCAFVRSAKTEAGGSVVKEFPHVVALDEMYEQAENFDRLTYAVCERLTAAQNAYGEVLYLTDGDGADDVAAALRNRGAETQILFGVAANRARSADTCEVRLTATDALVRKPYLDTALPVHITEIDDAYLAGDVKLWLMETYGDETEISVSVKGKTSTVPLCELDRLRDYDQTCELYIAAQDGFYKKKYGFGDLLRIMNRLTAADGCPWDKAQTHESIRINMIEEAYEAVDAIDRGDADDMTEEIGDVLLQAVFHCDMGKRLGEFNTADVLTRLCDKLVFRHTHIFGEHKAKNADEALGFWEAAKSEEKSYVSTADKLSRLPACFPALLAAEKVYKKLIKAGVADNAAQTEQAAKACGAGAEQDWARKLFWLVAAASKAGVDAEVALSLFVEKMKKEFAQAENSGDTADFLRNI